MDNQQLEYLIVKLKTGEYDGVDLMHAWIAIQELIELRRQIQAPESMREHCTGEDSAAGEDP